MVSKWGMFHTESCNVLLCNILTIFIGRVFHQHVFSALEGAKGLRYGELRFHERFWDAARVITNSLFQVSSALANHTRYARTAQTHFLHLTISFEVQKLASTFLKSSHLSMCMILGDCLASLGCTMRYYFTRCIPCDQK